ncbi:MAG: sulfite exporter TauE/SafE family protein [Saprospiraceae bacterium]|nr:sulfite exporter TauE/SafE family protein [Saprospiraceae bacterium]MBK7810050.1 sulfite exporter TauE/SafE family protein [Saprospiraceae bacterium]MBK9629652.1 sulfite exporter TauE/SafE family protein [Saprospiraceae bacterium]
MSYYEMILAIGGGFFAGCINTLAGNGSVITLGFLTEVMGLPGNLANGTNRIGIFVQGLTSLEAFKRNKKMPLDRTWKYLVTGIIGAIFGAWLAIDISTDDFRLVYRYLVLALLLLMIFQPLWLKKARNPDHPISPWIYIPVFLALGFYGGFIQMGMGLFFLAVMLYVAQLPIVESNAVKVFMVTSYTIVVIGIFQYFGLIDWKIGLTIAIGQGIGGWVTAQWASTIPNAELMARRFLIFIMVLTLLHLFGVFAWIKDFLTNF